MFSIVESSSPTVSKTSSENNTTKRVKQDDRLRRFSPPARNNQDIRAKIVEHRIKERAVAKSSAPAASASIGQAAKKQALQLKGEGEAIVPTLDNAVSFTNDPNDPAMKNKLKVALTSGAVNFSGREREILGKILSSK